MPPQPPGLHGHRDKWEGVVLVGDSSAQWELSAVTTSVCLRYGVFVVLPTSFIIITHYWGNVVLLQLTGAEKVVTKTKKSTVEVDRNK